MHPRILAKITTVWKVPVFFLVRIFSHSDWIGTRITRDTGTNAVNISNYLPHLGKCLDNYIWNYANTLLLGDFNSEFSKLNLNGFYDIYNLKKPFQRANLLQKPWKYSCIDLFPNNRPRIFQCTTTAETSVSDFQKLVVTVSKPIKSKDLKSFTTGIIRILKTRTFGTNALQAQILRYHNLMTLCYLHSQACSKKKKERKKKEKYMFKQL